MNKSIIMAILPTILGLGIYVHEVHAAPPIQVKCNMDPFALSNLLIMGVTDGDKLAISGVCLEAPGPGPSSFNIINSITLDGKGKGATLMGGGPVLTIAASKTVVVQDLTITGGNIVMGDIAGIDNNGTLTLIKSSVTGNSDGGSPESTGGIRNNGTLTLIDSSVSQNHVISGGLPTGGILNLFGKTATLINSTVSLNTADTQGGPGTGGIHNRGMLMLSNSTVDENHAFNGSNVTGGIRNTGSVAMVMLFDSGVSKNTVIDGSIAIPPVGGILNDGGTVSLSNTTVSKNEVNACVTCVKAVGGIYNNSPGVDTLVLTNSSTVSKNMAVGAVDNVGGIANPAGVPLPNIMNSIVKKNIPKDCDFVDPACIVAP